MAFPTSSSTRSIIDRRIEQMEVEGVIFRTGMEVGVTVTAERLLDDYHAAGARRWSRAAARSAGAGARARRRPFRDGFPDAAEQAQRRRPEERAAPTARSLRLGKHVVVIGGGDTGSDCIGTSFRQGAASVTQLEILPQPPLHENKALTWPDWPMKLRTSSSHEEGAEREFAVLTTRLRWRRTAGHRRCSALVPSWSTTRPQRCARSRAPSSRSRPT